MMYVHLQERLSVNDSLQSGHVEPPAHRTMTSQSQVPGAPTSPAGSVAGSGSCHALHASMPVIRSPNHSSDCPLGIYMHYSITNAHLRVNVMLYKIAVMLLELSNSH